MTSPTPNSYNQSKKVVQTLPYEKPATTVARQLLGATLVHTNAEGTRSGIIVETEAYSGVDDLASHGRAKPTERNVVMYGKPGVVYVYVIYGIYYMLNIVCEPEDTPAAVLIRAVEPTEGLDVMQIKRNTADRYNLCSGPGKLCQAFSINKERHNGKTLDDGAEYGLHIMPGQLIAGDQVVTGPRIGLGKSVTEPWLSMPWRYYLPNNKFVSKPK